jgi:signal transduction histidine kinase
MSDDLASGWLPIDALEDEQSRQRDASGAEADRLLALSERATALELMRLARADAGAETPLRPADLARVLARFAGGEMPSEEALRRDFPGLTREASVPGA